MCRYNGFSVEISHFKSSLGLPYFALETLPILCFLKKKTVFVGWEVWGHITAKMEAW